MADSTCLNLIADQFPPMVGWLCCDEESTTVLTLNGILLTHVAENFPLMARVRIFDQGNQIAESFSEEIRVDNYQLINLNEALAGKKVINGYFELTIFPKSGKFVHESFFSEAWCSVYTRDGKTAVNYPPLMARGADPSYVDSSFLYYPGVTYDDKFVSSLVVLNHQDFENEYDVWLYDASGKNVLKKNLKIAKKSLACQKITEIFPEHDLKAHFRAGAGMLVFHFQYKMNAFLQTIQHQKNILSGMDHLGILFARPQAPQEKAQSDVFEKRAVDPVICYCKAVSESRIRQLCSSGMNLQTLKDEYGIGSICMGCVADVEKIVDEKKNGGVCE